MKKTRTTVVKFETFQRPDSYTLGLLKTDGPSCFNAIVQVRKYQVLMEEISEPNEVLCARLDKLWRESEFNMHYIDSLGEVAKELGHTFTTKMGCDYKKE